MKEYKRKGPSFSLCGLNCVLCPRFHTEGSSRCPGCGGPDFALKHPTCAVVTCNNKHAFLNFKEGISMMTNERTNLVAPCGIDCGTCELNLCKNNEPLFNYLVSKGIPKENLPCEGCRNIAGDCPVIGEKCETYICATNKNANFCFECDDFPCGKLNPAADRAEILPHNTKVFNLCKIQRAGVDAFVNESSEIKEKYYKGKMEIGKGPKLNEGN